MRAEETGDDSRLGFTFRLAGGSGKLSLSDRTFFGWLHIERLELDVPNLPRPIDLAAGPEIFQRHRTRVKVASLQVQQRDLDRYVASRAGALAELGVDQLHIRACEGHIAGECRVREGPHVADLTFRVLLSSAGRDSLALRLVVDRAQVHGYLPTPAPLAAHRVIETLLGAEAGAERGAPRLRGLGCFELDPLPLFLWRTLPPAGWRLPATGDVELIAARSTRASLQLTYGPAGDTPAAAGPGDLMMRAREPYRDAEERLRLGDIDGAIRTYRGELAAGGAEQTFVVERLLSIACAQPTYFVDAIELARQSLGRSPDFAPAHAALASIAVAEDRWDEAAERYRTLCRIAEASGDDDGALHAALAAARLLRTTDAAASTPMYERVLALRPRHAEASEALAERYQAEGRWHELVRLVRARLAITANPTSAARDHTRLAEILGDRIGDHDAAIAELARAVELDPALIAAREAQASVYRAVDRHADALAALDAAAELYRERGDDRHRAAVLARSAALAAELGDTADAEARFRAALELDPDSEDALSGAAALLEQRGATGEAIAMWRRLIDGAGHMPNRLARYSCELGRSLLAAGELDDARAALTRATTSSDPEVQARARELIAQVYEAASDRAAAAAELAEAVDALLAAAERSEATRASNLRHNAASLTLSRAHHLRDTGNEEEATRSYQLAHSLAGPDDRDIADAAAAALLDHAAGAGNDVEQLRWIEVLLEHADAAHRASLLTRRAEVELARGRPEEALVAIDEALDAGEGAADRQPSDRVAALGLKARILDVVGDPTRRAHTLAARAQLLASTGAAVAQVIQGEADTAGAWLDAHDAAAALDAARHAVDRGDDAPAGADPTLERAVDAAYDRLAEAAWRKRAWNDVARGCQRLLDAPGDPETVARRWQRYGAASSALGRLSAARDALERALAIDGAPSDVRGEAARDLADLHVREDRPADAARALELYAADPDAGSDNARADAWYRAGDLYGKDEGGHDDAERCLEAALRLVSDHMRALDALERLKRQQNDFERVAVILGRKIAATARHPGRQKALLARLAQVQRDELGRTDAAREAAARALEIDPEFRPAVRFCAADAESAGDLERAVELYEQLSMAMDSDSELAEDLAGVAEERYAALRALERLHRQREDWSSLADTLARLSAAAHARGDEDEATRLRDEARALSGEPATPAARAQATRELESTPADELSPAEAISLAKNYQQLERVAEAIELLDTARARGPLSDEGEELLATLHAEHRRIAELAAVHVASAEDDDAAGALTRLRRALQLYQHSLRDEAKSARVRERIAALEAEADQADTAAVAHRHAHAIGERARELSAEGKSLDPVIAESLVRLREVAREGSHWNTLVEGLRLAAAVELDPEASAALLTETAAVLRVHLDDTQGAIDALGRALALAPRDAGLVEELEAMLSEVGDHDRRIAMLEQHIEALHGAERAPVLARIAAIHHEVFADADAAGARLADAHEADPTLQEVWLPLASFYVARGDDRAARALYRRALAELEMPYADRLAIEEAVAALDDRLRAPAGTTSATDELVARAIELERAGQRHAAIRMYENAAAEDASDPRPLEALARLYSSGDDPEAVSEILGRLITLTEDPRQRADLWRRRARLYRDVLHREAETYRCLKEAYAHDPESGEIAHELRAVAMVRGEWALAAELLYAEIAAAADRREAGALHHELGLIFDEKLLDPEQAMINYEQALHLDDEIPATPAPLARLYELAGRHADAARVGELAAERARDDGERGRLYRRAATSAERAGNADEARRMYNLAALTVEDDEESARAQDALARLSAAASDLFSRQELLQLRLSEETDAARRIDLLREMLEAATEAGDDDTARRYAEQLFESDPNDTSAFHVLRDRAVDAGNWDALASLQDLRAAATRDPADRAARFYELGRLYLDRLRDVNAAVGAFEQALAAVPEHGAALEAVAAIAYNKSDWPRARELYARIEPERCSLPEDVLWVRRGEIAEAMGREREAIEAFHAALELAPGNRNALAAMARAASRIGDHRKALEAMTALADLLPADDIKGLTAARLQLADLCRKLDEHDRALDYYNAVLGAEPDNRPALRAVIELRQARGDYLEATRALATLAALAPSPGQQAELLYRRGEIFRIHLDDPDLAADCYLKAIDLAPNHVPTLRRLIDYYWRTEDDRGLVELARDLEQQRALTGTDPLPLARMLVAAGLVPELVVAAKLAGALGSQTSAALAEALREADRARDDVTEVLCLAAARLARSIEGLTVEALYARASAADPESAIAAGLRVLLETRG